MFKKISSLNIKSLRTLKRVKVQSKATCYIALNTLYIYRKNYFIFFGIMLFTLFIMAELSLFFFFNSFNLSRLFSNWLATFLLAYTLYFSFILLFKRNKQSKFTAAIIKFWKRSLVIFWAIETFLFLFFVFVTLNTSQEPSFFIDQSLYVKNFQISWKSSLFNLLLIVLLINFLKFYNNNSNFSIFGTFLYKSFSLIIFLIFLVSEFSQLFFSVTSYMTVDWFNELSIWYVELDTSKIRTYLHYINLCIMLKFWHFFLIFLYFIFFSMNTFFFKNNVSNFFGGLIQNLIIYYLLSVVIFMYWFKHSLKFIANEAYFFFYLNTDWVLKYNFVVNFLYELPYIFII